SVQLASRARAAGLAVSPRMIFENPTVQQLAAALEALGDDGTDIGVQETDTRFEPMSTSGLSPSDLAAVTQLFSSSREGAT
ncbi:phosphopantetheine-binding protein, partial [Mycobacterium sp. 1165178.9]|uniref:phosphopantetheine-binding protein n=1 Tax=Mycobacterium sp. 1165178.9 TaxID=1834070 RepID=UPI000B038FAA